MASAKKQARQQARQQKKAEKREYKLTKQAQRQATRIAKKEAKQAGRTDRTIARQDGRTERKISQNEADKVAYENGMEPVNRAAGIISASGDAASGLADLATSLSGAGLFGKDVAALNTGVGKDRNISFGDDGHIDEISDTVSPFGGSRNFAGIPIWLIAIAAFALLFMNKNKRK